MSEEVISTDTLYEKVDQFITSNPYAVSYPYKMESTNYVWMGGTRWDCSSTILYFINHYLLPDVDLPETGDSAGSSTYQQMRYWGNPVYSKIEAITDTSVLLPGDLLYYGTQDENGNWSVTHVTMYLGQYFASESDTGFYQLENTDSTKTAAVKGRSDGVRISQLSVTRSGGSKLIYASRVLNVEPYNGVVNGYYYIDGRIQTDITGITEIDGVSYNLTNGKIIGNTVINNNGSWCYVNANGIVDSSYTGFASNSNGMWYVENGKVTFNKQGILQDTTGAIGTKGDWYYVIGSKVQTSYTGVSDFGNNAGWWYIKNGKVDFTANTVAKNKNGWWYVTDGKVQFGFTGLANYSNANGWWYIKNGKVDFTYTGVTNNKNGWWYLSGGKVQFGYTGFASNSNGKWYIQNGKVTFSANGTYTDTTGAIGTKGTAYTVVNSKVQEYTYTSLSKTMYTTAALNVRSGPAASYDKIGSYSAGAAVSVTGQCNQTGWYRVNYNGTVGYVSNDYVTTASTNIVKAINGSVSSSLLNSANKVYNELPAEVRAVFTAQGWHMYVSAVDINQKYMNGKYVHCMGVTSYKDKCIYLCHEEKSVKADTIFHEMGHFWDWYNGWASQTSTFSSIYKSELSGMNALWSSNTSYQGSKEFFADGFYEYLHNPSGLKKYCPKLYAYIDALL